MFPNLANKWVKGRLCRWIPALILFLLLWVNISEMVAPIDHHTAIWDIYQISEAQYYRTALISAVCEVLAIIGLLAPRIKKSHRWMLVSPGLIGLICAALLHA